MVKLFKKIQEVIAIVVTLEGSDEVNCDGAHRRVSA